jgi:hypothetical protein
MQTPPPSPDSFGTTLTRSTQSNLILVSNRLPVTVERTVDGQYDYQKSCGGLVSGMRGLSQDTDFLWYGCPGLTVPPGEVRLVEKRLREEHKAVPVFMDEDLARKHYSGFSSGYHTILANSLRLILIQIQHFGHCFTTRLTRLVSSTVVGKLTTRLINKLPSRLHHKRLTKPLYGFTTTTSCFSQQCSLRRQQKGTSASPSGSSCIRLFRVVICSRLFQSGGTSSKVSYAAI